MEKVFFSKTSVKVGRLHGVTSQEPVIIIVSAIKKSNLSPLGDISTFLSSSYTLQEVSHSSVNQLEVYHLDF